MRVWSIVVVLLTLAGCGGAAVDAAPQSVQPLIDPREPLLHARFSHKAGANLTRDKMRASGEHVEVWPRSNGGSVLYAATIHDGEACHPSIMVMLEGPVWPGARYALGKGTSLRFEEDCADGQVRSWAAQTGELAVEADPGGGFQLRILGAHMVPAKDAGGAVGHFLAEGLGLRVGLHN